MVGRIWPRVLAIGLIAAAMSAACRHEGLDVRVTALRDPRGAGRTYWLVPGAEGLNSRQLEYRRLESLVHTALRARGYQLVGRDTEPHLVVLVGYGVGPPQMVVETKHTGGGFAGTKRTYQAPLAGQGGVGSTVGVRSKAMFGGWTRTEVFTLYTTWIRLSAVDGKAFAAGQPASEVWSTTAMTDARGRDLQLLLPALLASAMDYFGRRVSQDVRVRVPPRSQRVEWLLRGGT